MLGARVREAVHMWRRFIDDIFFIWEGSEEKLKEFMVHCSNFHPAIKFTFDYDIHIRTREKLRLPLLQHK